MFVLDNVPLVSYTTMKLGGHAAHLTEVNSQQEVIEAVAWADERHLPVIMIGGGSNIFWRDEGYPGLVVVNKIPGFDVSTDGINRYVTVGAGVNWDDCVAACVSQGMTGNECLSLIPGTVGGTPVQNVGAYGQEVAQTIITIQAYDTHTKQLVNLRAGDCGFGYRTSIFKTTAKGRYFITAVTFFLTVGEPALPYYDSVQRFFDTHAIKTVTPQVMRQAIIAIRQAKLPDPAVIATNGSFFANPVISADKFFELRDMHPDLAYWSMPDDSVKLSAAWLIEHAGYKDVHDEETGMATWAKQPLVLVNEHAESTAQLLAFKKKIVDAVQATFGVQLEQEPELLP
ncbi:MAG: UDP-N-acetylmuramate dehydrogenase [Candidatus Saccharimonadales bacterium]